MRAKQQGGQLVFDLPRPLTRDEKEEVRQELAAVVAELPPLAVQLAAPQRPEDLRLRTKVELLCGQLQEVGLERCLRLLVEAVAAACPASVAFELSDKLRHELVRDPALSLVLRRAFDERQRLAPGPLRDAALLALALLGPGTTQPAALAEALLDALAPLLPCLPNADVGTLLATAGRRAAPVVPGAAGRLLAVFLRQIAERAPADFREEELVTAFSALGHTAGEPDPVAIEDFLESLRYVWPLCAASTLLAALLGLGQASILEVATFRAIVTQLDARSCLLGTADRRSLLLVFALHKAAFDRARVDPHPVYDEVSKRLIAMLARDAASRISTAPMEELARPVVALAELNVLKKKAKQALEERLASGRLLSLSPTSFVSIVYAHRLAAGPIPHEPLRRPFCLAFGALMHAMEPRQVASCIDSLWRYSSKQFRHTFEAAYERLARALEGPSAAEVLTPTEATAAIQAFPAVRLHSPVLLVRMLRAVTLGSPPDAALQIGDGSRRNEVQPKKLGMVARMSMGQLVDILEACGTHGLARCETVADALVERYRRNGGCISRRNTARAIRALAEIGERPEPLVDVLLAELQAWELQDPRAEDLKPRPALVALWSLAALDLISQAAPTVDWLLGFLCRQGPTCAVLSMQTQACLLFEGLCAVELILPNVALKHLRQLEATRSPVASQAFHEASSIIEAPHSAMQLLAQALSLTPKLLTGLDVPCDEVAESPATVARTDEDEETDEDDAFAPRSMLDELRLMWQGQRKSGRPLPRSIHALGEVLAGLNLGRVLRTAPHPEGALAGEATRTTGGFELSWRCGMYDVDWGHPYLRIGVLVLLPREFVKEPGSGGTGGAGGSSASQSAGPALLRAPARLRARHLTRAEGWRLVLLRGEVVQEMVEEERAAGGDQQLSDKLQARTRRANAMYPLDEKGSLRELWRLEGGIATGAGVGAGAAVSTAAAHSLAGRLALQLRQQLEVIFPGAVVATTAPTMPGRGPTAMEVLPVPEVPPARGASPPPVARSRPTRLRMQPQQRPRGAV